VRMNIEAERGRKGITKTELARILGVSLTTYASYLNGGAIPSDKLILMADYFNVSADYLLGRVVHQEPILMALPENRAN